MRARPRPRPRQRRRCYMHDVMWRVIIIVINICAGPLREDRLNRFGQCWLAATAPPATMAAKAAVFRLRAPSSSGADTARTVAGTRRALFGQEILQCDLNIVIECAGAIVCTHSKGD